MNGSGNFIIVYTHKLSHHAKPRNIINFLPSSYRILKEMATTSNLQTWPHRRSSGYMFFADDTTFAVCLRRNIFGERHCNYYNLMSSCIVADCCLHLFCMFNLLGQHASHERDILNITDGMAIFLFHTRRKRLYGPFRAVGNGRMYIDRDVFGRRSPYQAQVTFSLYVTTPGCTTYITYHILCHRLFLIQHAQRSHRPFWDLTVCWRILHPGLLTWACVST